MHNGGRGTVWFYLLIIGAADFDVEWTVRFAIRAVQDSGTHFAPRDFLSSPGMSATDTNMDVHEFRSGTVPRSSSSARRVNSHLKLIATI